MEISYCDKIPKKEDFFRLFLTTGWNNDYGLNPDELIEAVARSFFSISAYCNGELIGFGRIVSDGRIHAMIYDLIVTPDFQGRGIGTTILEKLVVKCKEHHLKDIQLFCAKGKRRFYERNGFTARPDDGPGMELKPQADSNIRSHIDRLQF